MQEVLDAEKGVKLTPVQATMLKDNTELRAYSRWVFLHEVKEPTPQLFHWRVNLTLQRMLAERTARDKTVERWRLRSVIEIGRGAPGQAQIQPIEDTDTAASFAEWLSITLRKPHDQPVSFEGASDRPSDQTEIERRAGDGDARYYTDAKEGLGSRFVTQSPLAQTANRIFLGCHKRILAALDWQP